MALTQNKSPNERRKHWRDRRSGSSRRNPARSSHDSYDCRSGTPRREADVAGQLDDADVWWDDPDYADLQTTI